MESSLTKLHINDEFFATNVKAKFKVMKCTDGNIVFRCDSGKNSLVIISML